MKITADYFNKDLVSRWDFLGALVIGTAFRILKVNRFIPMEISFTHHFFLAILGGLMMVLLVPDVFS
jgi:uncharacterized membrane protein